MLRNHIKIAIRHLWHSRLYAGINLVGLATGITCLLFAVLYWKDEHSYDEYHAANPHLYRITTTITEKEGTPITVGGTGQVQGPVFKAEVPEVKNYVRVFGGDISNSLRTGEKAIKLRPLFVDTGFLDVFTFSLLHGNATTALQEPGNVVITESTAKKFFNRTDVVGQVLQMDGDPSAEKLGKPLLVTAVVSDPPRHSSIQFDVLLTFSFLNLSFSDNNWLNAYLGTFVVLRPDANREAVVEKFNRIYSRYGRKQVPDKDFNIYGFDPKIRYGLQRITDIHLNPLGMLTGNNESGVVNGSNAVYSYIFMGIALFVLAMAGINIVNNTIGASLRRAKEVGIRKIAGGSRLQIMRQFLLESAALCAMALLLSLALLQLALPWFNEVSGKNLLVADLWEWKFLLYAVLLFLSVALLSGLYPAYIVSRFKPLEVLYNRQKLTGRYRFGRSLVVVQFALAMMLLMASLVYYRQMHFIRTKHLGYTPTGVLRTAIGGSRDPQSVMAVFKKELGKEPSIIQYSFGDDGYNEQVNAEGRLFKVLYKNIDENFLTTLQIPLKQGRNLSPDYATDAVDGILVNETFLKISGLAEPIGKRIKVTIDDSTFKTIRGVVGDVHFGSLREPIRPMVLFMKKVPDGGLWVKFKTGRQQEAMAAVERIHKQTLPEEEYSYGFLDEMNARQYLREARWQQVITVATAISFVVCCLGLFGLAHLSAQQRTKEIGIRKTLGASVRQIVALLSAQFLKLVALAFVIAVPVAWLVMNRWLQDFAYRTAIGPGIIITAGFIALTVAFAAIGVQTVRAAMANPVKNLRTE